MSSDGQSVRGLNHTRKSAGGELSFRLGEDLSSFLIFFRARRAQTPGLPRQRDLAAPPASTHKASALGIAVRNPSSPVLLASSTLTQPSKPVCTSV